MISAAYTICSKPEREIDGVRDLANVFGPLLHVGTLKKYLNLDYGDAVTWEIPDINKHSLEWSLRVFRRHTTDGWAVKVDPDTRIRELPEVPSSEFHAGGDFRYLGDRWVWMGGFQLFTRHAAEKLVNHCTPDVCTYQDVALAKALTALEIPCYNYPASEVDCWSTDVRRSAKVWHRGAGSAREPSGPLILF
jgi:hypothetical protein